MDIGTAGCKANIDYFKALREKLAEEALQALTEEMKWENRLAMINDRTLGLTSIRDN